jgi:hypothetical protein
MLIEVKAVWMWHQQTADTPWSFAHHSADTA